MPGGSVGRDQLAMAAKVRRHWFNPCRLGSRGHLGANFSLLLYTDLIKKRKPSRYFTDEGELIRDILYDSKNQKQKIDMFMSLIFLGIVVVCCFLFLLLLDFLIELRTLLYCACVNELVVNNGNRGEIMEKLRGELWEGRAVDGKLKPSLEWP